MSPRPAISPHNRLLHDQHPRTPSLPHPAEQVVGIVGATCGTTMGFIFPGMLALRDPEGGAAYKAFGWGLLAAGAVLFAVGITSS